MPIYSFFPVRISCRFSFMILQQTECRFLAVFLAIELRCGAGVSPETFVEVRAILVSHTFCHILYRAVGGYKKQFCGFHFLFHYVCVRCFTGLFLESPYEVVL